MKYFVCYTARDKEITTELLQSFYDELKKNGKVFIDMINNDSEDKHKRIISELDNSDILILIETNVYKSDWVVIELERAKANKIPIMIVVVKKLFNSQNI